MKAQVKVGQVWADNDKRDRVNRKLRVDLIDEQRAKCWSYYFNRERSGHSVWIRLDRFKPTANGYRLVQDVVIDGAG